MHQAVAPGKRIVCALLPDVCKGWEGGSAGGGIPVVMLLSPWRSVFFDGRACDELLLSPESGNYIRTYFLLPNPFCKCRVCPQEDLLTSNPAPRLVPVTFPPRTTPHPMGKYLYYRASNCQLRAPCQKGFFFQMCEESCARFFMDNRGNFNCGDHS